MNKKMIGLSALAVLSLAACNKNVENGVEAHGTTHAGLVVSVKGSSLRAETYGTAAEHQANADGKDAESKISSLYVLMGKDQRTFEFSEDGAKYNATPDKFFTPISAGLSTYATTGTKSYKAGPWLVANGSQKMAVIVNGTAPFNAYKVTAEGGDEVKYGQHGSAADDATYTKNLNDQLASLASDNNFVMSSKLQTNDVKDGVSKSDVSTALTAATANGLNADKNVFHFDLERLVCKGIVAKASGLSGDIEDGSGTVDLASLKYAAINGATQTYVLAAKAGSRTMTSETAPGIGGSYANYTSAIDGSAVAPTAKDAKAQDLVRLGNIGVTALAGKTSKYAPISVSAEAAAAGTIAEKDGVYFLENSMTKPIQTGGEKLTSYSATSNNNQAGYYRFAYAKVYAKVTPARLFYLDNSGNLKSGDAKTAGLAKDGTFYQGMNGQLYATVAAAKKGNEKTGDSSPVRVFIYNKGMCFYRALWNREYKTADMKQTSYASTRRNNIYVININSFKKLGMPFDPSDPNDPNLPAPGAKIVGDDTSSPAVTVPTLPTGTDGVTAVGVQPDGTVDEEAVKKDDPRIDKTETYMAVTATVLKWNVVTRTADL